MLVQAPNTTRVFDRIVCGVDSSPESLEAARQADRLRSSEGLLRLATVADVNVAVHAGFAATQVLGELDVGARDALHKAVDAVHPSSAHLLAGDPVPGLFDELRRSDATLVSVGPHGHSRMLGMLLGGMSTALLHDAPCSVLLARRPIRSVPVEHPLWSRRLGGVACRCRSGEDCCGAIRLRAGLRRGNRRKADRSRPDQRPRLGGRRR
jgi:nucleotide-binding universal stress UspA family protein